MTNSHIRSLDQYPYPYQDRMKLQSRSNLQKSLHESAGYGPLWVDLHDMGSGPAQFLYSSVRPILEQVWWSYRFVKAAFLDR